MLRSNRFGVASALFVCMVSVGIINTAVAQGLGGPGLGSGSPGGGGPGPGPGGPGGGPGGGGPAAPSPTFTYTFCNKANSGVVFIATVSAVGQQFRAQGWTQVPPGQCGTVGPFQRPSVWWYARAANGANWGNRDADICVNLNSGFDYTWDGGGRSCQQGESPIAFEKTDIQPQYNTTTMNLNP